MAKQCVLYDRECIDCGECQRCDLDPDKICDNCMKCVMGDADYRPSASRALNWKKNPKKGEKRGREVTFLPFRYPDFRPAPAVDAR